MSNPSEIDHFSRPGFGAGPRDMGPPDFFYSTCPDRLPQLFRRWSRGTNRRRCAEKYGERQGSKSRRNRLKHGFGVPPATSPRCAVARRAGVLRKMISIFKTEPQLCRPGEAAGPEMSAVGVTLSLPEGGKSGKCGNFAGNSIFHRKYDFQPENDFWPKM